VLQAGEGLGDYARARNRHRAAQIMAAHHGGQVPAARAALLALPGIGRYTAGAILSLAFGQAEPVLDGNVRRVLCRLYDIAEDAGAPTTLRRLWSLATELVAAAPPGQAGDLNEALMELGALICTPGVPDCPACPLADLCLARGHGTQAVRPVKAPWPATPHYDVVAAVIRDPADRYLVTQRPTDGLLGGLWGFPGGKVAEDEPLLAALVRTVAEQTGVEVRPAAPLPPIKHAYTHFRITLHPFRTAFIRGEARPLRCAAVRWLAADELTTLAFPVTDRKVIAQL
ncbi:MAG: A/G-specific adenine glycosylase, partial [Anaerolineae bacterium]